jgi:hypothetical protein
MGCQHSRRVDGCARHGLLATTGRRRLLGAAALALGLALAACGGKGASPQPVPIAVEDAGAPQAEPDDGVPGEPDQPAEPDASVPEADLPTPPSSEEQAEAALGGPVRTDVVALGISDMLERSCGGCHAGGLNAPGFEGGFDIGELIARGMIVPGSSAASPLIQNVSHGRTPYSDRPMPTAGDIALMARFIDGLRTEPPPSCERLPFLGLDEAWAAMLADVNAFSEADRPFLRYLGVSYASNAGSCGAALDEQRHALFKVVNSLSTASEIRVPVPIDSEERLYRVDLRDYAWNRPIDVLEDGVAEHADGWAAIGAAARGYALELSGPEASALASATGTPVPFLPLNAFVNAASLGDVYYSLVGLRPSVEDARLDRGIDLVAAREEASWRRAGLSRSGGGDALFTRVAPPAAPARDYWLVQVQVEIRSGTIYDEGLAIVFGDWSESIFRLPNGLMAFSLDQAGGRLGSLPRGCVGFCSAPEREVSTACHGCHAGGLLPVEDAVKDVVRVNAQSLPADLVEGVEEVFPSREEMAALLAEDNARYLAALDQAGVPRNAPDPISRVGLQFTTNPLDLEAVAAELGVPARVVRERLGELPPELRALGDRAATIERAALDGSFVPALCALGTRNRPVGCP